MIVIWARCLVANHAAPFRGTCPMPSCAAAGTAARGHDDRAGNDDDGLAAVRAASAHLTTVKARTAAAFYLDDHVGRSLAWCKRQGLRGAGLMVQAGSCRKERKLHRDNGIYLRPNFGIDSANPLKHASRSSCSWMKRQSITPFAAGGFGLGFGGMMAS
jgi:hypothetical protein